MFLTIIILLILLTLSQPETLKFIVDKGTKGLHLGYSEISGNVLDKIKLKNLTFKGDILADETHVNWSFKDSATGQVAINELELKKVNLQTLENFINYLQENSTKKDKHKLYLPTIEIKNLFLSTLPYDEHGIKINKFEIQATKVRGNLDGFSIDDFLIDTVNDHTNIMADGFLKDKNLHFNHLWIQDIDINKIIAFDTSIFKKKDLSKDKIIPSAKKDNNKSLSKIKKFLTNISVKDLKASTKPFKIKNFNIKIADLNIKDAVSDLEKVYAKKFSLNTDTNLGSVSINAKIKNNQLYGKAQAFMDNDFFEKYTKVVNFESLNPINLDIYLNKKYADANFTTKSYNLFNNKLKKMIKLKIKNSKSKLRFTYKDIFLDVNTTGEVSTAYVNNLKVKNRFRLHKKEIEYKGEVLADEFTIVPKFLHTLLNNSKFTYLGDAKDLVVDLNSDDITGNFTTQTWRRADVSLKSKKEIELNRVFTKLPKQLQELKANVSAFMPIEFFAEDRDEPLHVDFEVASNLLKGYGKVIVEKPITVTTNLDILKDSIIQNLDKKIKTSALKDLQLKVTKKTHSKYEAKLNNNNIKLNILYDINSTNYDARVNIQDQLITLSHQDSITNIKTKIPSLKVFQEKLQKLYDIKKYPYDGEVDLSAKVYDYKSLDADIKSKWLVYEYKENKFAFAEKIKLSLEADKQKATIKNYTFNTYLDYDRRFFSDKASHISWDKKSINIQDLWVNNDAKIKGKYDITKQKTTLNASSNNYHYKGKEGDIKVKFSINANIDKNRKSFEGSLTLKEGTIKYKPKKEYSVQDPDIIIVQYEKAKELKQKEQENTILNISIKAQKPIKYKIKNLDVSIKPEILIWKEAKKSLELLGVLDIIDGQYTEKEKIFNISTSQLLFSGGTLNPFLNINATLESDPYTINVIVGGTLDSPILNFNSTPYLNQSDILSIILFNSTTDGLLSNQNSTSNTAISMLGNTFAKEIVQNFGIKLDKLVLSTNEEGGIGVEIGKKISKKVTVIYINDIVSTVKIKYKNSRRFETDLTIGENSSGIDFLFKNEY
jgi:translocation and assembly module TamB